MSQHGQPESPHFSQSQPKTPNLVPLGTRWQSKWEGIRGHNVCTWSLHIKPHGSEEASKSSGGVLLAPKMLYGKEHIDQCCRQGPRSRHMPKQYVYTRYPAGARWQMLESDTHFEESIQTYWAMTASRPLMSLGLTLETGHSDLLTFGQVLVVLTLMNTHQLEQASPGSLKTSVKIDSLTPSYLRWQRIL